MRTFKQLRIAYVIGLGLNLSIGASCASVVSVQSVQLHHNPLATSKKPLRIAQEGAKAVGVLTTDMGRGLAFAIDPEGYVLTNRHVIEDANQIESLEFPANDPPLRFASVEIVYVDPGRDLALLKVHGKTPLAYLNIANRRGLESAASQLRPLDRIVLLRHESENEDKIMDGRDIGQGFFASIGRIREIGIHNREIATGSFFSISTPISRGQSGGPVLDRYGHAVGIVTWKWRDDVGAFATPISEAVEMLEEMPALTTSTQHTRRANKRVEHFISAMNSGQLELARKMIAPSYAREVRSRSLSTIAEHLSSDGLAAAQMFIAALENLIENPEQHSSEKQAEQLQTLVLATGSRAFLKSLHMDNKIEPAQVISFFLEFAQGYMTARQRGGYSPPNAMEAAFSHLQTMDAARSFAFAELMDQWTDRRLKIKNIRMIPGMYTPQMVVSLAVEQSRRRHDVSQVILQMRMEWGDWYIAELHNQI